MFHPVAIGLACLGALCVAKKKRAPSLTARSASYSQTGQRCPAMPWLADEVTQVMRDVWAVGAVSPEALAVEALRRVYPEDMDGQALTWPSVRADCTEKHALESRVVIRAERFVAECRDLEATEIWTAGGGY